jgi:hypothetical protein
MKNFSLHKKSIRKIRKIIKMNENVITERKHWQNDSLKRKYWKLISAKNEFEKDWQKLRMDKSRSCSFKRNQIKVYIILSIFKHLSLISFS